MSTSARQVTQASETVRFEYNEDGLRVRKIATSTGTTNYIYHGNKLVHLTNGSDSMHFFYDAQGRVAVVDYNGTPYIYLHNLQGDIIGLVGQGNVRVVNYWYDAWGRHVRKDGCLASTLGTLQPFRYRGYVYDEETGLYYLMSRYYNPRWGRFLNADAELNDNLYKYCGNAPVRFIDKDGFDYIDNLATLNALVSQQADLAQGIPASTFLERIEDATSRNLPYRATMNIKLGFDCSGLPCYGLCYSTNTGCTEFTCKEASGVGYIDGIGWENLPTPILVGQMVHMKKKKTKRGEVNVLVDTRLPFTHADFGKLYRVAHFAIITKIENVDGEIVFHMAQATAARVKNKKGVISYTMTLKEVMDTDYNIWVYPKALYVDK